MAKSNGSNISSRFAVLALFLLTGESAMSLEQPDYTVMHRDGDVEYRQYESYLVAETVIDNTDEYGDAGNEGFRRLFQYISGANRSQVKIDMTAPVSRTPSSEKIAMTAPVQRGQTADGWRVTFMLPSEYTIETAPIPTDERVRIATVPSRLMAVIRYTGRWTEKNFSAKRDELRDVVDAEDVQRIGEFESAAYDPPYTPPFLRRNEVMVEIDRLPGSAERAPVQQSAAS